MNFASKIREAINQIDWTVYVLILGTDIIACKGVQSDIWIVDWVNLI